MKPQSVVVNGTAINALKYTYDELTEILILKYDFDMNLNYNVEFINSAWMMSQQCMAPSTEYEYTMKNKK